VEAWKRCLDDPPDPPVLPETVECFAQMRNTLRKVRGEHWQGHRAPHALGFFLQLTYEEDYYSLISWSIGYPSQKASERRGSGRPLVRPRIRRSVSTKSGRPHDCLRRNAGRSACSVNDLRFAEKIRAIKLKKTVIV
jgi:hypothetical protein